MTRIQFKKGLHLVWHGRELVIDECMSGGEIQLKDQLTNRVSKVKAVTLIQALFQGELEFLELNAPEKNHQNNRLGYINVDFTQISAELRETAKRRYKYVERVLSCTPRKLTNSQLEPIISEVSKEIEDSHPPSRVTLYRWLKNYLASGQDIRSLIPNMSAKGNREVRVHPEVRKIINNAIDSVYLKTEQARVSDVYNRVTIELNQCNRLREAVGQEKLELPNISTIYRAIYKLDSYEKASCRYGKRIASQLYDPVQLGPRPTRPLERVEIDHTKLPLFVVDTEHRLPIGTPWLTSIVDKYSGVTLGYYASFEPPSYLSVMQCLLHAVRPKNYLHSQYPSIENSWDTYGLPEVIVVDNAPEFYSSHFEDACLQLGIVVQYSPPKMPWYKSAIERYFGAINTQLLGDKPGKNFSRLLQAYDYDPLKNAVVSFEALQEILQIFIVDIHNQSSHPELKAPRSKVWSQAVLEFPPALPPSGQELRVLIGNRTTRLLTRRGIEFEGLIYNSWELAQLRSSMKKSEKSLIKYDPTDISKIFVFNSNTNQFLEVKALSQEYTSGLSLWQHKVIKQLARIEAEKVDIVALALAKEKIQKIVEREWKTSKKGKTRTDMARWKGIGREEFQRNDQEFSQEQQSDFAISQSVNNSQIINSSNLKPDIAGISDIGSAFNYEPSPESTESEAVSSPLADNNNLSEMSQNLRGTKPKRKPKNSVSKKSATEVNKKVTVTEQQTEEWQPDLSGWDISIGLPK